MPDSTAETILQAVRAWIMAAGSAAGALTDAQVVVANDAGPRPALPYLTVDVTVSDLPQYADEPRQSLADAVTVVDAGADGDTFAITVDGEAITFDRGADDDEAAIATALAAAIRDALPEVSAIAAGAVITVAGMWGDVEVDVADAKLSLGDPVPVEGVAGLREGTISVQGFGRGADAWLDRSAIALRLTAIDAALEAAGLSVAPIGGMRDLSQLLDTSIEPRFLREYRVTYATRIEPAAYATAIAASIAIEQAGGGTITETIALDLET